MMIPTLRLTTAAKRLCLPYYLLYRGVMTGQVPAHKEPPAKGWWVKESDLEEIASWVASTKRRRPPRPTEYLLAQVQMISYLHGQQGLSIRALAALLGLPHETMYCYLTGSRPAPQELLDRVRALSRQ